MHEMSLCEGILQLLENEAAKQGFQRVKAVYVEIGALATVEVSALEFAFSVVMQNSLANEAALVIIPISALAWCMPCGASVQIQQRYDPCPHCGRYQLQITSGDELRVKELEVE